MACTIMEKNSRIEKPRICFFSGDITRSGGTERVSIQLANALAQDDSYNLCFVSLTEQAKTPFFEIDHRVKRYALGEKWINPGPGYLPLIRKLRKFLKEKKIDIIVDIDIVLDVLAIPASFHLKTKVISWEHFNCEFEQSIFYRKCISKLTAKFADYIVTLTKQDCDNYKKLLGRKKNIKPIYNMISKIESDSNVSRENWIVMSGRLTYQKGIDYLVEVAKQVLPKHPNWKWLILGEGEDRYKIEDTQKQYGLEEQLILEGRVENVEWYLNRARLMVLTSRYEGFGMCLVEALQMGVPCVSFDIKIGPSEIISEKKNGLLIPPFDCEKMAEVINKLLDHPEKLAYLASNTKVDFERFEEKRILGEWKHIINELLDR